MSAFLLITLTLALAIVKLLYNAFGKPGVSSVPGPWLAKFSNLWYFYHNYNHNLVHALQQAHRDYGDYVRIKPDVISINDPAMIDPIYGLKKEFRKGMIYDTLNIVQNGKIVEGLFATIDKAYHASFRKSIASSYAMTNLTGFEPYVDETLQLLLRRIDELYIKPRLACPIHIWTQLYAYDVISELTMGWRMGFFDAGGDVDGALADLEKTVGFPMIDWIVRKNALMRWLIKDFTTPVFARSAQVARKRIQARRDQENTDPVRRDLLSRALEDFDKGLVDEQRFAAIVNINLAAGTDTTSSALRTILYYTVISPDQYVLKKVQKELDAANVSYPVSYKQASALPYLGAIIKESLRIFYVPAGTPEREVPEGGLDLPNGVHLPKDSIVSIAGSVIQFNKSVYGQDADEFRPERWLQGADETKDEYDDRIRGMRNADMSLGKGSRTCIGMHIARLELFKTVAALFGLFNIRLAQPGRPWKVHERFLRKQYDMDMVFEWREGKSLATVDAGLKET